eukprot:GCRY01002658.1.p1 GENE.GCRY01002658.1~~GCRY01002658.1.p1  ORF type:complete len:198 (+),score=27.71 GCRY01002658.1:140-733(+)
MENINPEIKEVVRTDRTLEDNAFIEEIEDEIDTEEVFDLIRDITDPEHPLTLEQLNVVKKQQISVENKRRLIKVEFTPTIPHCSMSTIIGLCIRVRLMRSLPNRWKVDVKIFPGTHQSEDALNKQLNDKERCIAALENPALRKVVNRCLEDCDTLYTTTLADPTDSLPSKILLAQSQSDSRQNEKHSSGMNEAFWVW